MQKVHFVVIRLKTLVAWACVGAMILAIGLPVALGVWPVSGLKSNAYHHAPMLAIVIDDFGQARAGVADMLAVPLDLTCAVMPGLEYTQRDAQAAHDAGMEVIVHMPMQAHPKDPLSWYGPEPILIWHSYEQAKTIAGRAILDVPYAVGMNIHIGSESSEREAIVSGVMDACKASGLYFLDSNTSQKSVCEKVAAQCGLPFLMRHVFLEHGNKTQAHVEKQLKAAVIIAKARGSCVCIGHVGPEGGKATAAALMAMIPYFEAEGVEVVFASTLLTLEENMGELAAEGLAKAARE